MLRLQSLLNKTKSRVIPILTKKPHTGYSQIDKYLNRLDKPLYSYIIGANLGVFLMWNLPFIDQNFMFNNFTLSGSTIAQGKLHTFVTHAFSHNDLIHLGFNMLTFYFFGRSIEYSFGSKQLLYLYFAGILGSVVFCNFKSGQIYLGASGAVNAIITYNICCFPQQTILLFFLPVPAWALGLLIFYQSWNQRQYNGAHLGGIIAGGVYYLITRKRM